MEKYLEEGFAPVTKPSSELYGSLFSGCERLIFVGSCGIAVRHIAPFVKDKRTDPAVLCVDELGKFVISLLSGHIGGANELALMLADEIDAVPVVTTATDINGKFSVDAWAAKQGFVIGNIKKAKSVSAAILEHTVPVSCAFPVIGAYPPGTEPGEEGDTGIVIDCFIREPFRETLRLIPKNVHLGIGCRRGTDKEKIEKAVRSVFADNNLDLRSVKCAASIDLKADEEGLLAFCREMDFPVSFYSADELNAVEGDFTPSSFVKSVTGVNNVCERSALLGADKLIIKKTAMDGVTVAAAAEYLEVRFG